MIIVYGLAVVKTFVCLESTFNSDVSLDAEIHFAIRKTFAAYRKLEIRNRIILMGTLPTDLNECP